MGADINFDVVGLMDWATGVSSARSYDYTRRLQKHAMNWQEKMSNTAHQREVADLKAAGLNPVLAANGGADTGSVGGGEVSGGQAPEISMDPVSAYATLKQTKNQTDQTQANIKNDTARTKAQVAKDLAEAGVSQNKIDYYLKYGVFPGATVKVNAGGGVKGPFGTGFDLSAGGEIPVGLKPGNDTPTPTSAKKTKNLKATEGLW